MTDTVASGLIRQTIEKAERLIEERKAVSEDLKLVYAEAKAHGLDVKAVKEAIKYRAADKNARAELEATTELYLSAIGDA